ncbi:MAG: UDP-3-O-(3-hydroxymyristoyl)glucosamine N-acyltransferase [Rhodospirillaceae bacterium]|nr:UDP-3-O-(3-hydroxymyristoyl)glucosamine N-acyltransferase [Rhodospirillaceae bacterium]
MPDPRFFSSAGPFTVSQLLKFADVEIAEGHSSQRLVSDVAPLDVAKSDDLSFLDNPLYIENFSKSLAGVCIVHPDRVNEAPDGMSLLLTNEPYLAYAKIASAFYPDAGSLSGRENSEFIDPSASIGTNASISPGVVIGGRAEIGANCKIGPNSVIGEGVIIGDECQIGPSVSVEYSIIGAGVRLFAGARIGEAGFGFASGVDGHVTVPQLGRVIIGNGTEVGANSTIDRGSAGDTIIGRGCRIDNLVQIGHNVILGDGCIVVAQVGISGSTQLDDYVIVGGQVGIAGHLKIGKGVQIAAQSGVMNSLPETGKYAGSPAVPMRQWINQAAMLRTMGRKKVRKDG